MLSAVLLGGGFLLGRRGSPTPVPLVVGRNELALAPQPTKDAAVVRKVEGIEGTRQATTAEPAYGPDGTPNERPTDPSEVISMCGARTKKGTPCSRRVRGTGRCWQHRGRPAMLPASKLIVPS